MEANHPLHILMVEDVPSDAELAELELRNSGFQFTSVRVDTKERFLKALEEFQPHLIISDYAMPEFDGMQALMLALEHNAKVPFIVLTGSMNEETAVACMKAGATDYVIKDHLARLPFAVREALEKKAAENAFVESEKRYRLIVETAREGVWSMDGEYRTTFVNKSMAYMLGYEPDEMMGRRVDSFMFPEDLKDHSEQMEARALGQDSVYERRFLCKNGEALWTIVSACPLHDEQGNFAGSFAMFTDITERKQAEEALQESEKRYRTIMEQAADAVFIHDEAGRILDVNWKACQSLGYSREELLSISIRDIDPEAIQTGKQELWDKVLAGEQFTFESSQMRKDGGSIPVEVTLGKVNLPLAPAVLGIVRDITDRKQAKDALRESEQRFMDVLYSSQDAVLLIDGEHFVDCNEATARMLGYSNRNEFLKTHPSELSPPTQPDGRNSFEKANEMMRIASEMGFHQFEWEHRRANGEDFPVEVSLTSIVLRGKNVIHCMWREITERKRNEELLKQTLENLRKAVNATIQVMVSAVEVRDPYTAGHQRRVTDLAYAIGRILNLTEHEIEGLRMAGLIHDIGKLYVPAEILSKPGRLSDIEFELVKTHTKAGYDILKDVDFPWFVADFVLQHHEKLDGSGYPQGLKNGQIRLEAKILTVADIVEAMASHRPYRPSLGIDAALEEIEKNKGILYDPDAVDACVRLFRKKGFRFE